MTTKLLLAGALIALLALPAAAQNTPQAQSDLDIPPFLRTRRP